MKTTHVIVAALLIFSSAYSSGQPFLNSLAVLFRARPPWPTTFPSAKFTPIPPPLLNPSGSSQGILVAHPINPSSSTAYESINDGLKSKKPDSMDNVQQAQNHPQPPVPSPQINFVPIPSVPTLSPLIPIYPPPIPMFQNGQILGAGQNNGAPNIGSNNNQPTNYKDTQSIVYPNTLPSTLIASPTTLQGTYALPDAPTTVSNPNYGVLLENTNSLNKGSQKKQKFRGNSWKPVPSSDVNSSDNNKNTLQGNNLNGGGNDHSKNTNKETTRKLKNIKDFRPSPQLNSFVETTLISDYGSHINANNGFNDHYNGNNKNSQDNNPSFNPTDAKTPRLESGFRPISFDQYASNYGSTATRQHYTNSHQQYYNPWSLAFNGNNPQQNPDGFQNPGGNNNDNTRGNNAYLSSNNDNGSNDNSRDNNNNNSRDNNNNNSRDNNNNKSRGNNNNNSRDNNNNNSRGNNENSGDNNNNSRGNNGDSRDNNNNYHDKNNNFRDNNNNSRDNNNNSRDNNSNSRDNNNNSRGIFDNPRGNNGNSRGTTYSTRDTRQDSHDNTREDTRDNNSHNPKGSRRHKPFRQDRQIITGSVSVSTKTGGENESVQDGSSSEEDTHERFFRTRGKKKSSAEQLKDKKNKPRNRLSAKGKWDHGISSTTASSELVEDWLPPGIQIQKKSDNRRKLNVPLYTNDIKPVQKPRPLPNDKVKLPEKCERFNRFGFCPVTKQYPLEAAEKIASRCTPLMTHLIAPLPKMDVQYDVATEGQNNGATVKRPTGWSWKSFQGKPVCDTDELAILPGWARNEKGDWMIILQTKIWQQKAHISLCSPVTVQCQGPTCGTSNSSKHPQGRRNDEGLEQVKNKKCVQRFSAQRLAVFDPEFPDRCPVVHSVFLPSACVCLTAGTPTTNDKGSLEGGKQSFSTSYSRFSLRQPLFSSDDDDIMQTSAEDLVGSYPMDSTEPRIVITASMAQSSSQDLPHAKSHKKQDSSHEQSNSIENPRNNSNGTFIVVTKKFTTSESSKETMDMTRGPRSLNETLFAS